MSGSARSDSSDSSDRSANQPIEKQKMIVRRYEVDICDACIGLEGRECHTPGCIFCYCGMGAVSAYLNRMMIRPIIDGQQIENLQADAELISHE